MVSFLEEHCTANVTLSACCSAGVASAMIFEISRSRLKAVSLVLGVILWRSARAMSGAAPN